MTPSISPLASALSIDHGRLRLRLDLDLVEFAAVAGFAVILAVELAVIRLAARGYDAIGQLYCVT